MSYVKFITSILCTFLSLSAFAQPKDLLLKVQLDSILISDQKYRIVLEQLHELNDRDKDSIALKYAVPAGALEAYLWSLQSKLDANNLKAVEDILKQVGYPGKSIVGTPTNEVAWYIIQHSSKITEYLPLIKNAAKHNELPQYLVATMEDRLLVEQNKPQLYGTQAGYAYMPDRASKKTHMVLMVRPVKDPQKINERRKKAGFTTTIQEYAKERGWVYSADFTMSEMMGMQTIPSQSDTLTTEIKGKIRKAAGVSFPTAEISTSSFRYMQLADSFSKRKDSTQAGRYFLKIDPYYVLFLGQTPLTIDKYLNNFCLTKSDKAQYKKGFLEIHNAPKPAIYDTLNNFYGRLQELKRRLIAEVQTINLLGDERLAKLDSLQFRFLHRYIMEHGWPGISEGALYAGYIAGRDVEHYYDYLPLAKQSFLDGDIPLYMYQKIALNRRYYNDYMTVKKKLSQRYKKYDVTALIGMEGIGILHSQELLSQLFSDVKTLCPVKDVFFICYSSSNTTINNGSMEKSCSQYCGHKLLSAISDTCPLFDNYDGGTILWYYLLPKDSKDDKEFFYLIY